MERNRWNSPNAKKSSCTYNTTSSPNNKYGALVASLYCRKPISRILVMPEKYNGIKHYDEMALSKTHKLSKQILAEIITFQAFYKGRNVKHN